MDKERRLDQQFWEGRYRSGNTGWDIGGPSTPLIEYVLQLDDKNLTILIPGCGNAYEVDRLLELGFKNITLIDISPTLCETLSVKYGGQVKVLCQDFFDHNGSYDLILEQTFFCALDPILRPAYVNKVFDLLHSGGKVVGVLFKKHFDKQGPPFGGQKQEYLELFEPLFTVQLMEECANSISPRKGSELFFILKKKKRFLGSVFKSI